MKPKYLNTASITHTLMSIRVVLQPNSPKQTQSQEIQNGQRKAYHAWNGTLEQNCPEPCWWPTKHDMGQSYLKGLIFLHKIG